MDYKVANYKEKYISGTSNDATLAIRSDNTLWAWGVNYSGQLGLNDLIHRSSPVQVGGSWTSVSNSYGFSNRRTLAIKSNGTLWAWGNNSVGFLGQSNLIHRSSPVQIGTSSWNIISVGRYHNTAIRSDGTLWAWGQNFNGVLGQGNQVHRSSPVQIGTSSWVAISSGEAHTLAIKYEGTLWTWGNNFSGVLGQGNKIHRSSPVQIGVVWKQFAFYRSWKFNNFVVAIKSDGSMWSWGQNYYGNLGLGTITNYNVVSPTQIGTSSWSFVSSFRDHVLAIKADNTLWSWGANVWGELGQGDLNYRSSPVQIGTSSWIAISAGNYHNLAIRSDNTLWAWGYNPNGELGQGDTIDRLSPVQIGTSSWSSVSAGYLCSFAIKPDGTLWAWGKNRDGVLGQSDLIHRSSPVQIGGSWSSISAARQALALKPDKTLWVWGWNNNNLLGLGDENDRWSPVQLGLSSWSSVSAGYYNSSLLKSNNTWWVCGYPSQANGYKSTLTQIGGSTWKQVGNTVTASYGIKSDETFWGIAENAYGELGQGDAVLRSKFVQVGSEINQWSDIATSRESSFGIRVDGSLWAWGANSNGELGQGDAEYRSSPVQVATDRWKEIKFTKFAGSNSISTMGLKEDNTLWVWGSNYYGQLGLGDIIRRSSPIQLGATGDFTPVSRWKFISLGGFQTSSFAIRSDGTLWAWGRNNNGQLGLNDLIDRSSPVQVGTSSWTFVESGDTSTYAIKSDGTLWSWGYNFNGELGQGDRIYRSSPVQVGTSLWTSVSGGGDHTLAIRSDGTLWAWGRNNNGQLGLNDLIDRSSPVQVGIDVIPLNRSETWGSISAGQSYSVATKFDGTMWAWGLNGSGNLGLGDINSRSSPVQVGNSAKWKKVSTRGLTTNALDCYGYIWSWGNNFYGRLGLGDTIYRSSPVQIGADFNWVNICAGSAAIKSDGTLWTWGPNASNQLSLERPVGDSNPIRLAPTKVPSSNKFWKNIESKSYGAMALDYDGSLFAWGYNYFGQLGLGYNSRAYGLPAQPSPVLADSGYWTNIFPGVFFCFGKKDGTTWAWGGHFGYLFGKLGLPYSSYRSPVQIPSGSSGWKSLALQEFNSLGIKDDGSLWVWGNDYIGLPRSSPSQVGTSSWSYVSSNWNANYAIRTDGTLWAWGNNFSGELGQGNRTASGSPVQIGTSSWNFIAANCIGGRFKLAIRSDGTLWSWGENFDGELGQGDTIYRSSPVQIGTATDWSYCAHGYSYAVGLKTNGTLWTWGYNGYGQLGQGDINHRSSPVQVGGSWSMVTTGKDNVSAIRTDGTLWSWGDNDYGQLGIGGVNDNENDTYYENIPGLSTRSSPVQVGTSSWIFVSAGGYSTYAIKPDGTLWSWGENASGELAARPFIYDQSLPVQVGNQSYNKIFTSGDSSFAIKRDGTLWGWGSNNYRKSLGLGTISPDRSKPVSISGPKQSENGITSNFSFSNRKMDSFTQVITYQIVRYNGNDSGIIDCSKGNYFIIDLSLPGLNSSRNDAIEIYFGNVPEKSYSCIVKTIGGSGRKYFYGLYFINTYLVKSDQSILTTQMGKTPGPFNFSIVNTTGTNLIYLTTEDGGLNWIGYPLIQAAS
jgi:alpha-tubulin suppressor-like RCC1 family protein